MCKVVWHKLFAGMVCLLLLSPNLWGQEEREYIRKGNRLYKRGEYAGSEKMYRRAAESQKKPGDAAFNTGNALYRQNRFSEAAAEYNRSDAAPGADSLRQAEGFYNMGNALLKDQKFSESIEAYINSLRLDPGNLQAKYNLAYAQDQLKKQEEQDQQQDDKQQQQDNQDQGQQQDNDNQDNDNQENQDQDNKEDDRQNQDQQQQQEQQMSREDAQRLLDALAEKEREAREKVDKDKAAKAKVRVIKNW